MRWFLTLLPILLFTSCQNDDEEYVNGLGFDEFVPQYNDYIERWLQSKIAEEKEELTKTEASSDTALQIEQRIVRYERRQKFGYYYNFKSIEDLPSGLEWRDGLDQLEDSDPAAKKGGVFRYYRPTAPPTLRPFGPDASNGLRGELYDDVQLGLVGLNRLTSQVIPGVAREWACSPDMRTWYFKLHEDAAYGDDVEIAAKDFAIQIYLRVSDYSKAPYYQQYFREEIGQVTIYDEHTLAFSFPEPKSELMMYDVLGSLDPAPPHFYEAFGPDYVERYNWIHQPTSGPYLVKEGDLKKGKSITLTRNKNWWGNDKKFYRYRYNPDKIIWNVIRDPDKAFELFRAGFLDFATLKSPKKWYEDCEIDQVYNGYIEKHWWYNDFPRPQFGIEMNLDRPSLKNKDVRLGLAHAMNYDKVIKVQFWGDLTRLPGFVYGFGDFVNENVKPWPFEPAKAREYFKKAGFTEESDKGFLQKPDGTRLEFTLTHYAIKRYVDIAVILKDEAKKAGVNLILEGLDPSIVFGNALSKEFELTSVAWSVQPPYFSYYEYFHSRNAYDEQGNVKKDTNNVFNFADPEVDTWVEEYRLSADDKMKKELGHKIQQRIYEECIFIPGYMQDFERVANWRWLRWPNTETVKFCPPVISYPFQHYSFWIDEEMQKETKDAILKGENFPEVLNRVETYRKK